MRSSRLRSVIYNQVQTASRAFRYVVTLIKKTKIKVEPVGSICSVAFVDRQRQLNWNEMAKTAKFG